MNVRERPNKVENYYELINNLTLTIELGYKLIQIFNKKIDDIT